MKISTEIDSSSKIVGEQKAIEYIAKAGFDAWDFSMFRMCNYNRSTKILEKSDHPLAGSSYIKFARELKQVGLDNGIVCNQSHAPFPSYAKEVRDYFKRAIECTAEAGGQICVIHPDNYKSAKDNAELYLELLPFAKEHNVKIATENMFCFDKEADDAIFAACSDPEDFLSHLNEVNDDYLVACLDIGHAEMRGLKTSAVEMIKKLGSNIKALHIHDNDRRHDMHQIPFSMQIDYRKIVDALKEINYTGYITLEAYRYLDAYTKDNVFEGIKNLALSADKIRNMF